MIFKEGLPTKELSLYQKGYSDQYIYQSLL
jgi:hypothetical protein